MYSISIHVYEYLSKFSLDHTNAFFGFVNGVRSSGAETFFYIYIYVFIFIFKRNITFCEKISSVPLLVTWQPKGHLWLIVNGTKLPEVS